MGMVFKPEKNEQESPERLKKVEQTNRILTIFSQKDWEREK